MGDREHSDNHGHVVTVSKKTNVERGKTKDIRQGNMFTSNPESRIRPDCCLRIESALKSIAVVETNNTSAQEAYLDKLTETICRNGKNYSTKKHLFSWRLTVIIVFEYSPSVLTVYGDAYTVQHEDHFHNGTASSLSMLNKPPLERHVKRFLSV